VPNLIILRYHFGIAGTICLSVCRLVCKVYCGKMADWIQMPFAVVSRVGREMGALDGDGYHQRRRAVFGGEVGASHCNIWGICCVLVWKCMNKSSCRLVSWFGWA